MSEELSQWRDSRLNTVSKSFCAAKWYNASLHLGHGFTNSCHLPLPHPIDLEAIKKDPSALHNTDFKKDIREMMLTGVKPAECSYCWKIEDIGRNNISDRVFKSRIYSDEDIAAIAKIPSTENVIPKTIEVSFDRICNFACSYCNSGYSTKWGKDIKDNGAYQKFKTTSAGAYYADGSWSEIFGKYGENNPYVKAFFEWWPELSQSLQEIRVTGGEPSQSHNFWQFMELVKQYPSPNLRLAINSNLGLNRETLMKLINITHKVKVKEFDIYTSCEAYGAQAEYIRDGLNYELWRKNLVTMLEEGNIRQVVIMMTINSLCLFSITEFLDDMLELKAKYGWNKPVVDLNILRWPAFMSPLTLPDDIKIKLQDKLKTWYEKQEGNHLLLIHERAQIERLIDYLEVVNRGHNSTEMDNSLQYHDFKSFYTQYDIRRNKNFQETFPEIADWYNSIEIDQSIPDVAVTDGRITHYESGVYVSDVENYNKPVEEKKKKTKKKI
jgi:organic radical activating enzyme